MVSLLAAAAVSCTREIQAPDVAKATLTVTASLDAAMDGRTKASADGGLTNLAAQGGYSLRYNMELWSHDGETMEYKATPRYIDIADNMSMSVEYNLSLLAKKYKMVLWADIVDIDGNPAYDAYDVSNELTAIGFPEGSAFGSDEYDAFTAVADVNLTGGSKVIEATLKRPFAKIRVIDDRINQAPAQHSTHLEFPSTVPIPKTYNALTGGITYSNTENYNTYTCQSVFETDRLCLFTGYIFVPETGANQQSTQSTKYSFTIVVSDEKNTSVANVPVYDVTVRRNALTTVKGEIL